MYTLERWRTRDKEKSNRKRVFTGGSIFVATWGMRTVLAVLIWFVLLALCWPLAIAFIFLFPVIWLLLLPFRVVGFTIEAVFRLIGALLTLPFRLVKSM